MTRIKDQALDVEGNISYQRGSAPKRLRWNGVGKRCRFAGGKGWKGCWKRSQSGRTIFEVGYAA